MSSENWTASRSAGQTIRSCSRACFFVVVGLVGAMQLLKYSHRSLSSSKTDADATVDLVITPSWLSQGANLPLSVVGLVTLSN